MKNSGKIINDMADKTGEQFIEVICKNASGDIEFYIRNSVWSRIYVETFTNVFFNVKSKFNDYVINM